MNLDRRLILQAGRVKGPLGLAILAAFLAGMATVLQARQLSRIVAEVFLGQRTLSQVMPLLWVLLGVLVTRALLTFLSEVAAVHAATRVKAALREALSRRLLALGPAYAQGERSGELVNTATQGIEALDAYFSQYLPQLALAGALPLAYLAMIFPIDPLSAVILLFTGPLIPFFMFLIGSNAQALARRQWQALGRMSAYFLDTIQGLATLKALGRSREQAGRIAAVSEQYRATTMSVLRVTFLSALVLELLGTMGTAIIAVQVGLRLLYGRLGFEEAFFLLLLAPEFYLPLRTLGLRFHASMAGVSAARRIYEVLEQPVPEARTPAPVSRTEPGPPSPSLRPPFTIQFEDVHFAYPGREKTALRGVSFEIHPGEMVALVGASGAGKSTLVQLLLRFLQPDRGEIRVNGIPLSSLPVEDWRAQIAWVPQQPYLFHGTLAENLLLANAQAGAPELAQAARLAHLEEWIDGLPQKYDTPVGESGVRLSGGQAQRVALARAFLRDAPLLILDEPTAHLDVEQERLLQESLRRLICGRTVLVIAHRLSTVLQAHRVVLLDEGRVVESGAPAVLREQGGSFAHLLAGTSGEGAL